MSRRELPAASRKPAQRRRRGPLILAALLLTLIIACFFGYRWLVDPVRLRGMVIFALQSVGIEQPIIGSVEFILPAEIQIAHLELPYADARQFGLPIDYADMHAATRIEGARLRFNWLNLLAGRIWPESATIDSAVVRIERREFEAAADGGAANSAPIPEGRVDALHVPRRASYPADALPMIRINDLEVHLVQVEPTISRLVSRWRGRVAGEPGNVNQAGGTPRYEFVVTDHMAQDEIEGPAQRFAIRWLRDGLDASMAGVQLNTIAFLLPDSIVTSLRQFDLHGALSVEKAAIRGTRLESVTARLSHVDFCLPMEAATPPGQRLFPFSDIRIDAKLDDPTARTAVVTLTGRVRGAPLNANLRLESTNDTSNNAAAANSLRYTATVDVQDIQIPEYAEHPEFFGDANIPRGLRNFMRDYDPSGPFALRCTVAGGAEIVDNNLELREMTRIDGVVEPRGARAMYNEFPYPLSDVRGALRIVDGAFDLDGISGTHGGARIRVDGHVDHSGPWTGLNLRIRADNMAMNSDLYEALPRSYRKLWAGTSPIGIADVFATVSRPDGQSINRPLPLDVHIETRWLNATFNADDNLRLSDADALITIGDRLEIHDLHGYDGDAAVRVGGYVDSGSSGGRNAAELRIEAHDMPLHRESSAIGDGAVDADTCGMVAFSGVADVWGTSRSDVSGAPRERYAAHVKSGTLRTSSGDCAWPDTRGWVVTDADRLRILQLDGGHDGDRISGFGDIPLHCDALQIDLSAIDENLSEFLMCTAPPALAPTIAMLGLSGPGAITLCWRNAANHSVLNVYAAAAEANPSALPLQLADLSGLLLTDGGYIQLDDLTARIGSTGSLVASGGGTWDVPRRDMTFHIGAAEVPLDDALWSLITGQTPQNGDGTSAAGGTVDATLTAQLTNGCRLDGTVEVADFRGDVGLLLEDCDGTISGTANLPQDEPPVLDLGFEIEVGKLAGRAISGWRGRIVRDPDRPVLQVRDVQGMICGGALHGDAEYDPATQRYEISVTLKGASSDELQQKPGNQIGKGRLDATISLRGNGENTDLRTGVGELRIYDTSFVKVPILANLLETLRLRRDVDESLDFVELHFACEGQILRMSDVEIHGRDIRLVGEGLWNVSTDRIELLLVGANPRNWPRIAVLSDVVELAGSELVQYRVSGTIQKPEIVPEPLHRLTDPIKRILARSKP